MQKYSVPLFLSLSLCLVRLGSLSAQAIYQDKPFMQEYSIKYYHPIAGTPLKSVCADRNGVVKILSDEGLVKPDHGQFLYPGTVVPETHYRFIKDKKLVAMDSYQQQFVFLSDKAVFSDAWAGSLYQEHGLPNARIFAGGDNFSFLVSDGKGLVLLDKTSILWEGQSEDELLKIRYQPATKQFWLLGKAGLYSFSTGSKQLTKVLSGTNFTSFDLAGNSNIIIGTTQGYLDWSLATKKSTTHTKLPAQNITAVEAIEGKVWFGTSEGVFASRPDGKYDYYNGERWLPGNTVVDIAKGKGNVVLLLTTAGMTELVFKSMTLHDKAVYYDEQVRLRHIRNGFNASLSHMKDGNLATGYLSDSDNDGLWTSMYLAGEIFRYKVTKDPEALQNCRESLDGMERLFTINPVAGFPSRSFERRGYIDKLSDPDRWQHAPNTEWDWKATTSSDEVIGHIFAYGAMAELLDDPDLKKRAIALIDTVMGHIVANDMYLIDYNGKPTLWGKWNPAYVNNFPTDVGDRKLNSSNIVAMLQTAYHFTKKEKYKKKAFELMQQHGYYENLMRPMKQIGVAPDGADNYSKMLSEGWNHSDDEMYFVGYWGLYRYAFNDTLKAGYKKAILDHWQAERPEKEGAWNIFTALTGAKQFDLPEAVWYLKEYPLDLITWTVMNSHRKDIELVKPNFRNQTMTEVLPPDERPIQRHNGNTFTLDRIGNSGGSEYSAGDIWLLPYWMGRYLGVISAPMK